MSEDRRGGQVSGKGLYGGIEQIERHTRGRGRKKGTGRDGPLALSLPPLHVPLPDHSIFTRVYCVCVCKKD